MAKFEVKLDEEAIKGQVASAINEVLLDLAGKLRSIVYTLDPGGEDERFEYAYQKGFKEGQA